MKSFSRKSLQVLRPVLSRAPLARSSNQSLPLQNQAFIEKLSIHRTRVNLYDMVPLCMAAWVAPNATIIGQVVLGANTSVWYNAVIRGDINEVSLGKNCTVGEHTVIHTAASLPSGRHADADIGHNVVIQSNCSIYSCTIENEALIGAKSVLLEGCHIGKGAVILPNSVVPPGRFVPSNEIWGGNPVEYVRDLDMSEQFANYAASHISEAIAEELGSCFQVWASTYLKKETTQEDVDFDNDESMRGFTVEDIRSYPEL